MKILIAIIIFVVTVFLVVLLGGWGVIGGLGSGLIVYSMIKAIRFFSEKYDQKKKRKQDNFDHVSQIGDINYHNCKCENEATEETDSEQQSYANKCEKENECVSEESEVNDANNNSTDNARGENNWQSVIKGNMRKIIIISIILVIVIGIVVVLFCVLNGRSFNSGENSTEPEKPSNSLDTKEQLYDISRVFGVLEFKGLIVKSYDEGTAMLEALDDEMDGYLDDPTKEPLAAYLFANDPVDGRLVCEVFFFRSSEDANKLYGYLYGGEQFVEGVSEIRIRGNMVYMGLIAVLDEIENA